MSVALICAFLWVLAATAVAFLPMKRQYAPGLVLLVAAPLLVLWLGWTHGWLWALVALAAFVSMFRHPLRYLAKKVSRR